MSHSNGKPFDSKKANEQFMKGQKMAKKTKIKEEGGTVLDASKALYCAISLADGNDVHVGVESSENGAVNFRNKLCDNKEPWLLVIDQNGKNKQTTIQKSQIVSFFFYQ